MLMIDRLAEPSTADDWNRRQDQYARQTKRPQVPPLVRRRRLRFFIWEKTLIWGETLYFPIVF